MRSIINKSWMLIAWVALFWNVTAEAQVVSTAGGEVVFTSRVALHTFSGVSNKLKGNINFADSSVDFYVDLASLETGIGKRDKDMRTTLETGKYPFAEFFGKLSQPVDLSSSSRQQVQVKGKFSLHGVTKDIVVQGSLVKERSGWKLEAAWSLNLSDYNIKPPKLLIVKVDEKQEITIRAVLTTASN